MFNQRGLSGASLVYRKEGDVLGQVKVPGNVYFGPETQRAVDNFPVSGMRVRPAFIRNYAILKRSCAIANMKCGNLDEKRCKAIVKACDEIIAGKFLDQFPVDIFQAGAGTSTNMNLNEVIANRAIELIGGKRGDYKILHPNDHANMSQSTNDTFHTAIHISTYEQIVKKLLPSLRILEKSLEEKSKEFANIMKVGRTHLQEAVPMTLGQEFHGFKGLISSAIGLLDSTSDCLLEIPLGGTAIGTMINTPPGYQQQAITELGRYTGFKFRKSPNMFAEMRNTNAELVACNAMDYTCEMLIRISNDLRLLVSGPRTGFADIILPEMQPGSSIMPGKINPSMPEMLTMVCMQVQASCYAIRRACGEGQLELNVFMPVTSFNLMFSLSVLPRAILVFDQKCVRGITPNLPRLKASVGSDLSSATALTPLIGYEKAAEIARNAYKTGRSIREVALEMTKLKPSQIDELLDPAGMVH
jgi:aspartate ammonia-lyase